MAGVITHIYIADLLVKKRIICVKDRSKYLLGSIAPDSIMSKEHYQRDDKKVSHLREGISSDNWYLDEYKNIFKNRISEFYKTKDIDNNDFALGYLVHLLTDQAFHYTFRMDIVKALKENNLPYTGRELMLAMVNELDALDYMLLRDNNFLYDELFKAKNLCSESKLDKLIDSKSLCSNFDWIEDKFSNKKTVQEFKYYSLSYLENLFNQVLDFVSSNIKSACG